MPFEPLRPVHSAATIEGGAHPMASKLAGSGGYATRGPGGVVSIRQLDGRIVLEMTVETWERLGQSGARL